jgi:hypothetical protein
VKKKKAGAGRIFDKSQVLGVVRMKAVKTNCLQSVPFQSIGSGTESGMGTCEKPLAAASSLCLRVLSAPHSAI